MAGRRKKTEQKVIPLEPIQDRCFDFVWKNGRILLSNLEPSTVNLLVSHGYEGLVGATTTNPFATPSRILNSASISSDIDETRGLLDQLSLSTRENPEEFQLGHEEALYLMHEVGAIQLRTEGDISPFDAPTLFKLLCEHQVGFPPRYFVYRHYRKLGWVVKLGAKVGVDLLLYPHGGPSQQHAQYGVSIQQVSKSSPSSNDISWSVATRVLDTIAKNLLVVLVTELQNEATSPLDASNWHLDEIVLSRWQSNSTSSSS